MRKLSRILRNSQDDDFSLPTWDDPALNDSRPMDTQEQEELVRELEKVQGQQTRLWRLLFAWLLFCFAAFLLYSTCQQVLSPWELRYHAYFMEEVPSWIIISADWLAVVAFLSAIIGLLHDSKHHRQWIWYSLFTGIVLAVFWLYYMLRLPRFRWDVIWLPFGPLSCAGLALYVDHLVTESSEEMRKLRGFEEKLKEDRKTLAIQYYRHQLLETVERFQVVIVVGEFGCGKTTQIPQYLHQAGYTKSGRKKIACVEPRRAAAICASAAVSQDMGVELGHEVGYCINHDDCTTKDTILKYITDGMLVQEWLGRQDLLASYGVVIVDEAQERTLESDYYDVFALVKRVARARSDLKLVIVLSEIRSTSDDAEKLSVYFDKAPILRIPHRQYRCS